MKVLVSSKQHVFSQGLIRVLKKVPHVEVVAASASGFEILDKAIEVKPNLVFLDEVIDDYDIVELSKDIKEQFPNIHIVIVMKMRPTSGMLNLLNANACTYLHKDISESALLSVLEHINQEGVLMSPIMAKQLIVSFALSEKKKDEEQTQNKFGLSKRKMEILNLVAKGASNKEIASALFITESTVKVHLSSIFEKLKLRSRREVVDMAKETGIGSL